MTPTPSDQQHRLELLGPWVNPMRFVPGALLPPPLMYPPTWPRLRLRAQRFGVQTRCSVGRFPWTAAKGSAGLHRRVPPVPGAGGTWPSPGRGGGRGGGPRRRRPSDLAVASKGQGPIELPGSLLWGKAAGGPPRGRPPHPAAPRPSRPPHLAVPSTPRLLRLGVPLPCLAAVPPSSALGGAAPNPAGP